MRFLREYTGLSRKEFGTLFHSKERTVCEWENGGCVPKLPKLLNISTYFGISMESILIGKTAGGNQLEEIISSITEADTKPTLPENTYYNRQLITQFHSLPNHHKERMIGYLEALCRENGQIKM